MQPKSILLACIIGFQGVIYFPGATCKFFEPLTNENETEQVSRSDTEVRSPCGDWTGCNSQGIYYKPYQPIRKNERVVWTVFIPGAKGYEVSVQHFGYKPRRNNDQGTGLFISGFSAFQEPTHFIPSTKSPYTFCNTSMLIVTFTSGPWTNNQNGFILNYKAIYEGHLHRHVNPHSRHYTLGYDQFHQSHFNTKANELTSFVFLPRDNRATPEAENRVVYLRSGLWSCKTEHLKIYFFNSTSVGSHKWQYKGRLCQHDSHSPVVLIRSPEPILIIFESSKKTNLPGFQFTYSASA